MVKEESQKEKLVTKVTSIAEEEAKSGQKISMPSIEKLVSNASVEIFKTRKQLYELFGKMSKKATLRTVAAIFSLPDDGVPVDLKTEDEKLAHAAGQRNISSRFIVMQHHINQEIQKRREEAEKLKQQEQNSEETKGEKDE